MGKTYKTHMFFQAHVWHTSSLVILHVSKLPAHNPNHKTPAHNPDQNTHTNTNTRINPRAPRPERKTPRNTTPTAQAAPPDEGPTHTRRNHTTCPRRSRAGQDNQPRRGPPRTPHTKMSFPRDVDPDLPKSAAQPARHAPTRAAPTHPHTRTHPGRPPPAETRPASPARAHRPATRALGALCAPDAATGAGRKRIPEQRRRTAPTSAAPGTADPDGEDEPQRRPPTQEGTPAGQPPVNIWKIYGKNRPTRRADPQQRAVPAGFPP